MDNVRDKRPAWVEALPMEEEPEALKPSDGFRAGPRHASVLSGNEVSYAGRAGEYSTTALAALSLLAALAAGPALAARDRDIARDLRVPRVEVSNTESLIGIMQALNIIDLDRGQNDKIRELVTKYRTRMDDVSTDPRLRPSEREDRLWELRRELRGRVIHVLNQRQKERVFAYERRFVRRELPSDRYEDRRDRRAGRMDAYDWLDLLGVFNAGGRR